MTFVLTWSTLDDEIERYCEDTSDEFVAALPGIKARAHAGVQRDLDLSIFRDVSSVTATSGSNNLVRDSSWLTVSSIFVPSLTTFLDKRSYDYVRMIAGSGTPRCWADATTALLYIAPAPTSNLSLSVETQARQDFSGSTTTTWITDNCSDLLLLRSLIEAESFLLAPERAQEFLAAYKALLPSVQYDLRGLSREAYAPMRNAAYPIQRPGE